MTQRCIRPDRAPNYYSDVTHDSAALCCGVINGDLVLRLGAEGAEKALEESHVRPMDFTGRPMKGYVYVAKQGVRNEAKLRKRLQAALDFVATLPPN